MMINDIIRRKNVRNYINAKVTSIGRPVFYKTVIKEINDRVKNVSMAIWAYKNHLSFNLNHCELYRALVPSNRYSV